MYVFKTRRQVQHIPKKSSEKFRIPRSRENPQVLGLALTVHHDTRNKMLLNFLHVQDYCISYNCTLLLETAIANVVVENTKKFDGLYVPPFLKKGTFVFFAIDNTDFAEDTVWIARAQHMAQSQQCIRRLVHLENQSYPIWKLVEAQNLSVLPYHVPMKTCTKPKPELYKR